MTDRRYFEGCMALSAEWLRACLANPSTGMRPVHLALMRLALLRKTGATP